MEMKQSVANQADLMVGLAFAWLSAAFGCVLYCVLCVVSPDFTE
jgi:hypothetical protein